MNDPIPDAARLVAKHADLEHDPYAKDAFSFPGGGSGVGYATITPECFKHPAKAEVMRMPGTDEERLAEIERLIKHYEDRRFVCVSLEIEDAKWLIAQSHLRQTGRARNEESDTNG